MKKKSLKSLALNKKVISRFEGTAIIGGATRGCSGTTCFCGGSNGCGNESGNWGTNCFCK